SRSPVPAGLIKVPLFIKLPLYIFSKVGQIGTLIDYIHFEITVCGNSSRSKSKSSSLNKNFFCQLHFRRFLSILLVSQVLVGHHG
ncbi:MAG: hypothetical protein SPF19_14520, partial [Oliverpabstia sp.]|nr:hypothetical protein [Lachnospiraceae bacterium]MDY5027708.1 hypothetical protein [Oliverpabstia sp.]